LATLFLTTTSVQAGKFKVSYFTPSGTEIADSVSVKAISTANPNTVLLPSTDFKSGDTITVDPSGLGGDKSITLTFTRNGVTTIIGLHGASPVTQVLNIPIPVP